MDGQQVYSKIDIEHSKVVYSKWKRYISGFQKVLDVGAGIGRVAEKLFDMFQQIHLLEPVSKFVSEAKKRFKSNHKYSFF